VFDTEPDTLPPLKPKGKASVVPAWRHIRHNFIMSVYSSQEAIDTDDGMYSRNQYVNLIPEPTAAVWSGAFGVAPSCV
jgi:hypothetical protein